MEWEGVLNILCKRNRGYYWTGQSGSFFKGYLQDLQDGKVLTGAEAMEWLLQARDFAEFIRRLKRMQGLFAVILKKGDAYWIAVDHAASFPLYYSGDMQVVSDCADSIREEMGMARNAYNPLRMLELYETSYVAHQRTVYDGIFSLQCGEAICINGGHRSIAPYYTHKMPLSIREEGQAMDELEQIAGKAVKDTLKAVGDGRRIVLSLSGGYDSRFLACLLKRYGAEHVICYCYGQENSFEAFASRQVAQALGYEWHFIEYSDKKLDRMLDTDYDGYCSYAMNHDNLPHGQTLLAVKELKERGALPQDAVFLTGLTHDMPTGSYIPAKGQLGRYPLDMGGFVAYTLDKRFYRIPVRDAVKERLAKDIRAYLEKRHMDVYDYQSFISAYDAVSTAYSHAKHYIGMARAFEYFGYPWLLPCWDKRLLNFWYSVSADMRIGQGLYERYLMERLLPDYGLARKKTTVSVTAKNRKLKYFAAHMAARVCFPLGIPLRRKSDVRNTAYLETRLYQRIKQKKALFDYRESIRTIIQAEYLEKVYGTDWYGKIKGYFA